MLNPFEHDILNQLRVHSVQECEVFLAVSGGSDSMALLEVFFRLKSVLKLKLTVMHVHHGESPDVTINHFRAISFNRVKEESNKKGLPFLSNANQVTKEGDHWVCDFNRAPQQVLNSEANFREFRLGCFAHWVSQVQSRYFISLAHHREDLLETRLIQMIRGAGLEGINALKDYNEVYIRPLLSCSKKDLVEYCCLRNMNFVEDPSNKDTDPLRNWIRQEWLPALESKRAGGIKNLSASLNRLVALTLKTDFDPEQFFTDEGIILQDFLVLSINERRQVLASYMKYLQLKNYTSAHINEILKRLDSSQKELTFSLLKSDWFKDARCIKAVLHSGYKGRN